MNIRSQSVLIFIIAFLLFVNFSYTAKDVNIVKRIIPQLFKVKKVEGNKLILEVKWDGTGIKDHGMIYNQETFSAFYLINLKNFSFRESHNKTSRMQT